MCKDANKWFLSKKMINIKKKVSIFALVFGIRRKINV